MFQKARKVSAGAEGSMIVYEGALTELITKELYLPVPYYTHVTRKLKAMGCIKQLRRGGGASPSQWQLLTAPTEKLWQECDDAPKPTDQKDNEIAQLAQQLRDLSKRTQALEEFARFVQTHLGGE
jgi:hypothetical protein